MTYETILPDHARAEAPDLDSALAAARQLVDDVADGHGQARLLRRDLIVTRDGRYDGLATALAREGRAS